MKYLILISKNDYKLSDMKKLIPKDIHTEINVEGDTLYIRMDIDNRSLRVQECNETLTDFNAQELEYIYSYIVNPSVYLIHFKEEEAVKKLLRFIAYSSDILIDNDHDVLTTGKEFIKMFDENPNWNLISTK